MVECVRSKTRGISYDSCSVGKQYTISKIEKSDTFGGFKYLMFKERSLGHFSHFFKKVDKLGKE